MTRIVEVPNGDDVDRVRVCEDHEWASLPVPAELGLPIRECPQCEDYDAEAGRARYLRLLAEAEERNG